MLVLELTGTVLTAGDRRTDGVVEVKREKTDACYLNVAVWKYMGTGQTGEQEQNLCDRKQEVGEILSCLRGDSEG